jgi:hypothetical protein
VLPHHRADGGEYRRRFVNVVHIKSFVANAREHSFSLGQGIGQDQGIGNRAGIHRGGW